MNPDRPYMVKGTLLEDSWGQLAKYAWMKIFCKNNQVRVWNYFESPVPKGTAVICFLDPEDGEYYIVSADA